MGTYPASLGQLLALALPSVAGAAAAYALALVAPDGGNRVVHGVFASVLAVACTVGIWFLIFLSALRQTGTAP